ncbi:hypothetical protein GCM10011415_05460 [Salipiger pallidus]|uniref:Uncharacterized protein n=1 Tax=Salipiger pallidus TaxID=1775170 RepID=A0A8J2ZH48_9RHOB|nr:hypothetical protein [Salipiger pallidus]GGG62135.1 hypothetical protein GCM10011415_05460 [Salipiger pallidus]
MNTSPIDSWDGAEAVFTYADNPAMMGLFLLVALAITFGTIIIAAVHEKHAYNNH